MSEIDPSWSVFWARGSGFKDPPSSSALYTGKSVGEDPDNTRADETVGFIVLEAGHGTIGGVEFEAALGADTVKGIDNGPPFTYSFNSPFASSPQVAVTSIAGMDGNNGAWSQTYGSSQTTNTTLDLSVDEDDAADAERKHTTEQVAYVVFASPVVVP
jgi:hypothetical protein